MRITMKTLYSTPQFNAQPGDTIDVPRDVGDQLIQRRYAVPTGDDPAAEKPEDRIKRQAKKSGKKKTTKDQ